MRCNENTKENTLTHTEGSQVLTRSTTPTSVYLFSGHLRQGRGLTRNARMGGLQQRRASSSKASRLDSHPSNIMSPHEEPRVRNWLHQSNRNCRARHGATGVKRDMPTRARTPEGNEQEAQKAPSSFVTDDPSSFPFVSRVCSLSYSLLNRTCFHNREGREGSRERLDRLPRNITHRTTTTATAINAILTWTNIGPCSMRPKEKGRQTTYAHT